MGSGLGTALKMLTAWELERQLALDLGLGGPFQEAQGLTDSLLP